MCVKVYRVCVCVSEYLCYVMYCTCITMGERLVSITKLFICSTPSLTHSLYVHVQLIFWLLLPPFSLFSSSISLSPSLFFFPYPSSSSSSSFSSSSSYSSVWIMAVHRVNSFSYYLVISSILTLDCLSTPLMIPTRYRSAPPPHSFRIISTGSGLLDALWVL